MERRKKGSGQITYVDEPSRKSKWKATVLDSRGKQKTRYFKTEKEAKAFLREVNADANKLKALMESGVTFTAFSQVFLEEKQKSNLKVTAYETLRQNVERVNGYLGKVMLRDIDSDMVQQMIFDLAKEGYSESVMSKSKIAVNSILNNPTYLGHMAQQRCGSISYKNHKRYKKDESEWIVVKNTHEPIVTQELWDKVREVEQSVSQGRKTKRGYTHPLSGFLFCADCGGKMKLNYNNRNGKIDFNFNCGNHMRIGKAYCFSHYISAKTIEEIVLGDIREMSQRIVLDEKAIREEFIRHNAELADKAIKSAKKELQAKRKRTEELSRLMQLAYEDRLKEKMPEDICIGFIQKYSDEQKRLGTEIVELEAKLAETENTMQSADEFIRDIKKYLAAPELTREMCYELIDRIIVGGHPKHTGKERVIEIVYKIDIASVLRHKLNNPDK